MFPVTKALPTLTSIVDRREAMIEWSRDRRVVHLGCVDQHLLDHRHEQGLLLHADIVSVARSTIGVDLDAAGLERLGVLVPGDYRVGDVQELAELQLPLDTELVLAPELIEHLPLPGRFLRQLADFLAVSGAEAVITTPNAYDLVNVLRFVTTRRESVHPDHLLLFSPSTLDKIVSTVGLEVVERHVHRWGGRSTIRKKAKGLAVSAAMRVNPWIAPGLVWKVRAPGPA